MTKFVKDGNTLYVYSDSGTLERTTKLFGTNNIITHYYYIDGKTPRTIYRYNGKKNRSKMTKYNYDGTITSIIEWEGDYDDYIVGDKEKMTTESIYREPNLQTKSIIIMTNIREGIKKFMNKFMWY